jgi:hypothetical protein
MRYYNLARHWTKKIQPHLSNPDLIKILVSDFNKYTSGRWPERFEAGMVPRQFESPDWQVGHRGPEPGFWAYVKYSACHWIVNFALRLAMLAEPTRVWRIVTSEKHSTVWDGKDTLFEFNRA